MDIDIRIEFDTIPINEKTCDTMSMDIDIIVFRTISMKKQTNQYDFDEQPNQYDVDKESTKSIRSRRMSISK